VDVLTLFGHNPIPRNALQHEPLRGCAKNDLITSHAAAAADQEPPRCRDDEAVTQRLRQEPTAAGQVFLTWYAG